MSLDVIEANAERYEKFYRLLMSENEKFNITAITDKKEFDIKCIEDCIAKNSVFKKGASVLEIGSGGGFPSVPLKIARPDLKFTLIESNEKKCNFLKKIKEEFAFEDFSIICGRAEELANDLDLRESFDHAVARAVAPLNILTELLLPFVKVGGKMIAFKGSNYEEEIESANNAVETLGGVFCDAVEYELDEGFGKRALVVVEKIKTTDNKFPRKYAKIKKCPL